MTTVKRSVRPSPGRLLAGAAAIAAALLATACGDGAVAVDQTPAADSRRIINVAVESLQARRFTDQIRLTGAVIADREVTVAAEEGGTVAAVLVDEGQPVTAGQALVRLDDELLRAQRNEARAQSALAAEMWARRKRLYEQDGVGTEGEYLEARYAAEQAAARLELIEARLRRTVVDAPFAGLLDRRWVEVGSVVAPGQAVADIYDLEPLKVATGVPERYAPDVAPGARAVVAFAALGDTCHATVSYVGAVVDGGHRTFRVELDLERPVAGAKPAMVAEVELVRQILDGVIVVPRQALVRTEQGFSAFVAVDGDHGPVAAARPVRLGPSGGDEVVVTAGLGPDERLIVIGQAQIAAGDRLRIVPGS